MIVEAEIKGIKDNQIWLSIPITDNIKYKADNLDKTVAVELTTSDSITSLQRRKAYVLIKYISEWWGYTPLEATKELSKLMFASTGETLDMEFSLSDCSKDTARKYITYLIDFCLTEGIPCGEPLYKLCEDIPKYVWACAVNKRCAVCGKKAQWHHAEDRVGMGRTRTEICHLGMRGLPLCARHHSECHTMAQSEFNKRYMLESIPVDEKIADVYKLRKKRR